MRLDAGMAIQTISEIPVNMHPCILLGKGLAGCDPLSPWYSHLVPQFLRLADFLLQVVNFVDQFLPVL